MKCHRDAQTSGGVTSSSVEGLGMAERICSAERCPNPHLARGWCSKHYKRWRRGAPIEGLPSALDRLWANVAICGDGCWMWKGKPNSVTGYGSISFRGKRDLAHRFAYELLVGPIPTGLQLDHLCRVRNCVRPDHLEAVSARENTIRGVGPSAQNARRQLCREGHAYSVAADGKRYCRICKTKWQRQSRALRKAGQ